MYSLCSVSWCLIWFDSFVFRLSTGKQFTKNFFVYIFTPSVVGCSFKVSQQCVKIARRNFSMLIDWFFSSALKLDLNCMFLHPTNKTQFDLWRFSEDDSRDEVKCQWYCRLSLLTCKINCQAICLLKMVRWESRECESARAQVESFKEMKCLVESRLWLTYGNRIITR